MIVIGPETVPAAMVMVMEMTLTFACSEMPLIVVIGTEARYVPVTVTSVPIGPLLGEKEAMVGAVPKASVPRTQRASARTRHRILIM